MLRAGAVVVAGPGEKPVMAACRCVRVVVTQLHDLIVSAIVTLIIWPRLIIAVIRRPVLICLPRVLIVVGSILCMQKRARADDSEPHSGKGKDKRLETLIVHEGLLG
jgi:hypothetical protein